MDIGTFRTNGGPYVVYHWSFLDLCRPKGPLTYELSKHLYIEAIILDWQKLTASWFRNHR